MRITKNTTPNTEFPLTFCAGIGPLQLGVVLVFHIFTQGVKVKGYHGNEIEFCLSKVFFLRYFKMKNRFFYIEIQIGRRYVISPKIRNNGHLDQKVKEFITLRVQTILANLSRQDFISHVDALMERKLASPRSPAHQNDKYCEEILADKNKFGRDPNAFEYLDAIEFGKREAREAQFLKDIKDSNDLDTFYQDVLGFYSAYLANAEKAVSTFVGRDYDPPPGYIEGDKDKEEINVKE